MSTPEAEAHFADRGPEPGPGMPPASIVAALIKAQAAIRGVEKTRQAGSKGGFGYKYASTEDIIAEARGALHSAGLAVLVPSWVDCGAALEAVVIVVHESGESWAVNPRPSVPVVEGKGRPRDKALAGALTYAIGYVLRGLLQIPRPAEGEVDARDDSEHDPPPPPKLPSAGVIRNGQHRGKPIAKASDDFLADYLNALGDGPGDAAHVDEIRTEITARLATEAESTNGEV